MLRPGDFMAPFGPACSFRQLKAHRQYDIKFGLLRKDIIGKFDGGFGACHNQREFDLAIGENLDAEGLMLVVLTATLSKISMPIPLAHFFHFECQMSVFKVREVVVILNNQAFTRHTD